MIMPITTLTTFLLCLAASWIPAANGCPSVVPGAKLETRARQVTSASKAGLAWPLPDNNGLNMTQYETTNKLSWYACA
jgi:hypothetical protein